MQTKKERVAALERLIRQYQASYYDGEAEISDGEFDLLWDELKTLAPDSEVLKKIGSESGADGFPKARHLIPMGSQDKASNPQEFLEWAEKIGLETRQNTGSGGTAKRFIVQYKLDGAS